MKLSSIQAEVLTTLVDRYENRRDYSTEEKSPRRTLLKVDTGRFFDYHHPSDATYRRTFNAEMQQLEKDRLIGLEWEQFSEGEYLQRIILAESALPRIYQLLNRRSKIELYRDAEIIVSQWKKTAPPELEQFYNCTLEKLQALEKLPGSLKPGRDKELNDILAGLHAVFEPRDGDIAKRLLSVRLYGDSKRWQALEQQITMIIKEFNLIEPGGTEDSAEALAERGIVNNPGQINLAGPLVFSTSAGQVDLQAFYPDLGLSTEMAADLTVASCPAEVVVTVENKTSFYQYVRCMPDAHLAIYLGGYHNPPRRKLLRELDRYFEKNNRRVSFYHWGDLDYGGITIWQSLVEKTGLSFQPLFMDEETYLKHLAYGQPIDDSYCRKLAGLLENPALEIFHALIRLMLEHKMRIEQEAVEIKLHDQ
jgi:hypothetical protein